LRVRYERKLALRGWGEGLLSASAVVLDARCPYKLARNLGETS
jgi:hypothetical protein